VTFPRRGKNIKENCWRKLADYLRLIRLQIFTAGGGFGCKEKNKDCRFDLDRILSCPDRKPGVGGSCLQYKLT
jgi:hypothetical protein